MLHKPIDYQQNLPFSICFSNVREEVSHFHKEVEIILLLRGRISCQVYHMDYQLEPGEMMISDVEDLHRIHDGSNDALMLQLHIDTRRFEEMYPNISYMFFVCEDPATSTEMDEALRDKQWLLKTQIAKLALDYMGNPSDFVLHTDNINGILSTLVTHFRGFYIEDYQYRMVRQNASELDLDRMSRITRYLLTHYEKKVTLEDVAETEHLNPYYVSHLIKKTLGFHFQSFLNGIRLEFAEKKLLFTDQNLTQIAQQCGFSSLNYFNKCFASWYGMTPAQYRKSIPSPVHAVGQAFHQAEGLELLSGFLSPDTTLTKLEFSPSFSKESPQEASPVPSPTILLRSLEDIMRMGYYGDRILTLRPAAMVVHDRLLTPTNQSVLATFHIPVGNTTTPEEDGKNPILGNTASALFFLLQEKPKPIPMFGSTYCLFTKEGLATPLYTAYLILSQLPGDTFTSNGQMIQAQTKDRMVIILYNPAPTAILNVSMKTKNLPAQFVLTKKQISEENNCFHVMEQLGNPSSLPMELTREIDLSHIGVPHFSMVRPAQTPILDYIIYPQQVTILEIRLPDGHHA